MGFCKRLIRKYNLVNDWKGVYVHKITGELVCAICLNQGRVSPLFKEISGPIEELSCGPCAKGFKKDQARQYQ